MHSNPDRIRYGTPFRVRVDGVDGEVRFGYVLEGNKPLPTKAYTKHQLDIIEQMRALEDEIIRAIPGYVRSLSPKEIEEIRKETFNAKKRIIMSHFSQKYSTRLAHLQTMFAEEDPREKEFFGNLRANFFVYNKEVIDTVMNAIDSYGKSKSPKRKSSSKKSSPKRRTFATKKELETFMFDTHRTSMLFGTPFPVRVGNEEGEVRFGGMVMLYEPIPKQAYTPAQLRVVHEAHAILGEMIKAVGDYVRSLPKDKIERIQRKKEDFDKADAILTPFTKKYVTRFNKLKKQFAGDSVDEAEFFEILMNKLFNNDELMKAALSNL
jgi:hypothetical protein